MSPQGFCPEAKTRGDTLEAPVGAECGEVKSTGKNLDFRELGPQRINETLAKDLRHARKGLTTRLIEFTYESSLEFEPESSTSQVRVWIQLSFLFFFSSFYLV